MHTFEETLLSLSAPKTWASGRDMPGFSDSGKCLGYPGFGVWGNSCQKPYWKIGNRWSICCNQLL